MRPIGLYSSPTGTNELCVFTFDKSYREFSAQNENSWEYSHHRRAAKFSISRNYAWPDVYSMASMAFFSFWE